MNLPPGITQKDVDEQTAHAKTEMERSHRASSLVANERCANCRFYIDGFCQRFPPALFQTSGMIQGHWPAVGAADWCGEWKKGAR